MTFCSPRSRPSRITLPSLALLALALAVGCSSDDGDGAGDELAAGEPPAMRGITAAHNAARAAVEPPAARPIRPLSWSSEVAAAAQAHANDCVFRHSGNGYGENLFATSGSAAPADVVASWTAEAADYDHASNSCDGTCGHYTQVVWADSLRLGCGVADCAEGSPFSGGAWQIWVCNYDPPGNLSGRPPYE
jgi:hypothetical protein